MHRGGVVAATLLCGISSVFADDTEDRLKAYKENRLIPQEFNLIKTNSDSDVMFTKSTLSWSTSGALTQAIKGELAKMNAQELLDFIKAKEGGQTALDYLAALANGSETSANISAEEAKANILALITECVQIGSKDSFLPEYQFPQAPWNGVLDISGMDVDFGYLAAMWDGNIDMSNLDPTTKQAFLIRNSDLSCFKMTGEQFASFGGLTGSTLPEITGFTGTEDFSHWQIVSDVDLSKLPGFTKEQFFSIKEMNNYNKSPNDPGYIAPQYELTGSEGLSGNIYARIDFSGCSGKTGQLRESNLRECILPSMTLDGSENLAGCSFSGIDFSNCSGMTGSQFTQARSFENCKMPQISFTGSEDFSKVKLYGLDVSTFTGISAEQISKAARTSEMPIYNMRMTSSQFNAWKNSLANLVFKGCTATVYVDGVETQVEGTYTF